MTTNMENNEYVKGDDMVIPQLGRKMDMLVEMDMDI